MDKVERLSALPVPPSQMFRCESCPAGPSAGRRSPTIAALRLDAERAQRISAQYQELFGVQWVLMMAGSMIMIIPMLVIFLLGQRFFVEGVQLGGVKG